MPEAPDACIDRTVARRCAPVFRGVVHASSSDLVRRHDGGAGRNARDGASAGDAARRPGPQRGCAAERLLRTGLPGADRAEPAADDRAGDQDRLRQAGRRVGRRRRPGVGAAGGPTGADEGPVRPAEAGAAGAPVLAHVRIRRRPGAAVEPVARLGLSVRRQRQSDHQPAGLSDQQPPGRQRRGRRGLCRAHPGRRNPDGSGRRGTASAGGGGRRLAPVRLRAVHRQHPQRHLRRPVRRRGRQSGLGRLQQENHSAGDGSGDQGSAAVGRSRRLDRPLQGRVRDRPGGPGRGAAQGRQRCGRVAPAAGRCLLQRPAQALDHHRPDRRPDPPDRPGRGRPHPGRDGDDQGPGRLHRLAAGLLRLPEDRSALPVSRTRQKARNSI